MDQLRREKKLFIVNWTLTAGIIISLYFFSPGYVVAISYVLVLIFVIWFHQNNVLYRLALGSILSAIWLIIAHEQYGYLENSIEFFNINIFPLFLMPLALVALMMVHRVIRHIARVRNKALDFLLFLMVNFFLVTFFEYVGYHWFDIHNLSTSAYPGLPWCDCLHAPVWMQIAYYSFGPMYYILIQLFRLDDRSINRNIEK